jgi:SAM-dependent methyltransferase
MGELVSLAVERGVLTGAFVERTGLRVGEELVALVQRRIARAGIDGMGMLLDRDDEAAPFTYRGMGTRMRTQAGKPAVEARFDLDPNGADVPACWSERGVATGDLDGWPEYWERLEDAQPVFEAEARDYVDRLRTELGVGGRVLDFGCGFAWGAHTLAPHVDEMLVWDAAANMRKRARLRLARHPNAGFVDLSEPSADAAAGKFDAILVNSVVQYMTEPQLLDWLRRWRGLLAPGGRLVLSDVMLPHYDFKADLAAFLWFSFKNGFLLRSVIGGIREIGNYRSVEGALPLLKLDVADLERLGARVGLKVTPHPRNLTFHAGRLSAVLEVAGA